MKLDGKVKGGLAWAGLIVILAVPAADMIFGKPAGSATATAVSADAATATGTKAPALKPVAATDPIQTASVDEGPVVDKFLKSGKKLPSYISDADEVQPVATTKAPAVKPPLGTTTPTTVAAVPAETPPVPLPRDARPKATQVASLPAEEEPLIIDEPTVKQPSQQASVDRFPMSDDGDVVTGDELEEWDSGSLADYLERRGLMTEASTQAQTSEEYDPDGFFLDEGPNQRPPRRNLDFFLF
jgi:hypothetical protein